MPDGGRGARHDGRSGPGHGGLQTELRRQGCRAGRPARGLSQPAGQRSQRHRGRHGHQLSAAQPRRSGSGAATPDQPPRRRRGGTDALHSGSGSADRRQDHRAGRHPRRLHRRSGLVPDPRHRPNRAGAPAAERNCDHGVALSGRTGAGDRADQGGRQRSPTARHRRRQDLSDRTNGTCLVIEVKNGFNPEALLEQLYKVTKMEDTFGINAVALVDGQPRTLNLRDLLTVYIEHRYEVTRRRTAFARSRATDRLHLVEGLLVAILDIDDVIAIIRSSDDVAQARERLIAAFELSENQSNYILDMPLRRLTKFSRLELESERDKLQATIAELTAILDNPDQLRALVGNELAEMAQRHGTPRRTILLAASGVATTATTAPLEVTDDPCWVLLSSAGLLARTDHADPLPAGGLRVNHDVLTSKVITTARGECGLVTSAGRLLKINVLDLPTVPATASAPNLQGGTHVSELITLSPDERVLCLTSLSPDSVGLALGTAGGVVKRVNPEVLARDSWEVIRLDPGDKVVGAVELRSPDTELVFVTNDAQLLRFPAGSVRPQGRSGGGMAGIKLGVGGRVVFFGAAPATESVVVTVSGTSRALPGTDAGSVKVTPIEEYPAKGRATGGVRCHRFLKGEDVLLLAWVGPAPAVAAAASGSPIPLPDAAGRRDGSGTPVSQPIGAVGSAAAG